SNPPKALSPRTRSPRSKRSTSAWEVSAPTRATATSRPPACRPLTAVAHLRGRRSDLSPSVCGRRRSESHSRHNRPAWAEGEVSTRPLDQSPKHDQRRGELDARG